MHFTFGCFIPSCFNQSKIELFSIGDHSCFRQMKYDNFRFSFPNLIRWPTHWSSHLWCLPRWQSVHKSRPFWGQGEHRSMVMVQQNLNISYALSCVTMNPLEKPCQPVPSAVLKRDPLPSAVLKRDLLPSAVLKRDLLPSVILKRDLRCSKGIRCHLLCSKGICCHLRCSKGISCHLLCSKGICCHLQCSKGHRCCTQASLPKRWEDALSSWSWESHHVPQQWFGRPLSLSTSSNQSRRASAVWADPC